MIGPALNLHSGGRGFLPLGLKSEFSILLDELPTRLRVSSTRSRLVLRRQPLAIVPPDSVKKPPRDVNASGWDLTDRGCVEKQAFQGHFNKNLKISEIY